MRSSDLGEGPADAVGTPMPFGEYLLIEELAHTHMSDVYAALQPSLDRLVAIKRLAYAQTIDPVLVEAFVRQDMQTLAALEHPHITRVYAGGTPNYCWGWVYDVDGSPYFWGEDTMYKWDESRMVPAFKAPGSFAVAFQRIR